MFFNLDAVDSGVWYPFQDSILQDDGTPVFMDPEENAGKVCVRNADSAFYDALYKKTRKKVVEQVLNPTTRIMERQVRHELIPGKEVEDNAALWDHMIVDWDERICSAPGKPIPCNKVNKVKMMKVKAFDRFIWKCMRSNSESQGIVRKAETENL